MGSCYSVDEDEAQALVQPITEAVLPAFQSASALQSVCIPCSPSSKHAVSSTSRSGISMRTPRQGWPISGIVISTEKVHGYNGAPATRESYGRRSFRQETYPVRRNEYEAGDRYTKRGKATRRTFQLRLVTEGIL